MQYSDALNWKTKQNDGDHDNQISSPSFQMNQKAGIDERERNDDLDQSKDDNSKILCVASPFG